MAETRHGCRCTLCTALLTELERREALGGACTLLLQPSPDEVCRVCHVGARMPGHHACSGCEKEMGAG